MYVSMISNSIVYSFKHQNSIVDKDLRDFVLQSYVLQILKELKNPKRFDDLAKGMENSARYITL